MIQIAPRAPVVMNVVRKVGVMARPCTGINATLAVGIGACRVSVLMNFAVDDSVVIPPNLNPTLGAALDFKSIDDVVTAVQVDGHVAIRGVLPIDHRPAS